MFLALSAVVAAKAKSVVGSATFNVAHERCRAFLPIPENDRAWNEPTSVTFTQRFSEPAIPEEGASLRKEPERSRQPFNRTQREEQT
jgi:hypothetical protein